ncbi:MAG: spermidine synthase [Dactylosporangium sp.]|nr:spermidine synthase [Dactylosporangium sp.]NNJ63587.1 spermidine synthase [Dactylosporangium sp.]
MSLRFEELDWRETPMGAISLRRRLDPALKADVYEVKLDDDYLMSSLFTVSETELAHLGLAALPGTDVDVAVGGLGLGYTARAVLADPRVRTMTVVEALDEVIGWHRRALLPFAAQVTADPRSRLVHGDFFAMAQGSAGFDPREPGRRVHAILVDIDHSPRHVLHPSHAGFYTPDGLRSLSGHLHPGGVFALWSNDSPDEAFVATLGQVFVEPRAHIVTFPNPVRGGEATSTIYVATTASTST